MDHQQRELHDTHLLKIESLEKQLAAQSTKLVKTEELLSSEIHVRDATIEKLDMEMQQLAQASSQVQHLLSESRTLLRFV